MNQVDAWALIVGAVTPFLVAVINQPGWSALVRRAVAVGVALILGVVTVAVQGGLSLSGGLVTVAAVLGASQAAYALVWKPTGVTSAVESATTRKAA